MNPRMNCFRTMLLLVLSLYEESLLNRYATTPQWIVS